MSELDGARVMVTGGAGFLGRRICALLEARGATPVVVRSSDHDLTDPDRVRAALDDLAPDMVIHGAAVVGGIGANRAQPGRFFYDNATMGLHLIHEAHVRGIAKFLTVGTVCSYPKFAPTPFSEDDLWNGYPEETNAPYGLAKKMLLVQSQSYREQYGFNGVFVIPTNLYGPEDNFDLATSHVIPAIIRKCVEAREHGDLAVGLWGSGLPTREFLYVDDAAEGIVLALERYDAPEPINLGTLEEISIADLAEKIRVLTRYEGRFEWDDSMPDGQPRRQVDSSRAREAIGFEAKISLDEGLRRTVEWYENARASVG